MNQALIAAISFCLVFGLQLVLQQLFLQSSIHPLHLITMTNSLSFLFLTVYALLFRRDFFIFKLSRRNLLWFLLATYCWIFADLAVVFGLTMSSSVNLSLLSRLQVFATYFGAILFLGEKGTTQKFIAIAISFLGTVIVINVSQARVGLNLGDILFLVFTACISVSAILRQKVSTAISSYQMTYLMFGISALTLNAITLFMQPITSAKDMTWFIAVNSLLGLIGFSSVNFAIAKGGATFFTLVTNLLPVSAVIFSFLVFRTLPTINQIIGGCIIVISIFLFTKKGKRSSD
jgi:drug/metabolite transporter (DMT)-like permease